MPRLVVRSLLSAALYLALLLALPMAPAMAVGDGERDSETMTLTTAKGKPFTAYRTGPLGARYGILLIHESRGFTDDVRAFADWLGRNGHRVLALDLYDGRTADSRAQANALMAALDQKSADAKYRAAVKVLKAPGRKLIAMGWEFGGTQALQANTAAPGEIAATVAYDAILSSDGKLLARIDTPVLGVFARGQSRDAVDRFRAFEAAMKRKRKPVQIAFYDRGASDSSASGGGAGTGEAVGEAVAPVYNGDAVRAVWGTTAAFLKKYVK